MGPRNRIAHRTVLAMTMLSALLWPRAAAAQASFELLPPSATAWNIGLRVVAEGDHENITELTVRYRKAGEAIWSVGLPLSPVLTRQGRTLFAASLLEVSAGTVYEVLVDTPSEQLSATVATRDEPVEHGGRVKRVTPDTFATALDSVNPGDTLELVEGTYLGPFLISRGGTASAPVTIRPAAGARVEFRNRDDLGAVITAAGEPGTPYADHVHLRDLVISGRAPAPALRGAGSNYWVVSGCLVYGGIVAGRRGWWIEDNFVVGRYPEWNSRREAIPGGTGITAQGREHVVAYNQVAYFYDGINTADPFNRDLDWPMTAAGPQRSTDIVGNLVYAARDDGIQIDHVGVNHRIQGNRVFWAFAGISLQELTPGPVYATRNVVSDVAWEAWKISAQTRGVRLFHNTSVSAFHAVSQAGNVSDIRAFNNLFVGRRGVTLGPATRGSQWNNNAFNSGADTRFGWRPAPSSEPTRYETLQEFAVVSGQERHGLIVDVAADLTGPLDAAGPGPVPIEALYPSPSSRLRGAASELPGVTGTAATIGALHAGATRQYGPRRLIPGAVARGLYTDPASLTLTLDPIGYSPLTMREQIVRFIDVYNVSLPLMTGLAFAVGLLIGIGAATWWARRRLRAASASR